MAERARGRRKPPAANLVQDIKAFIARYVVLTEAQRIVMALWVAQTHVVQYCQQTPYIYVSSPDPECGKSRLMEVSELIVDAPWMVVNPSEAVLFRKVHADQPTLLWDEIDTVFAPATERFHQEHRAMIDQGHRRHGRVPRFIGEKVVEFRVFCPKMFAGIGALPDTIARRSIPIRMKRRIATEVISDFIVRDAEVDARKLRERIAEWAEANGERVGDARPANVPEELSDRMKEGCFSLLAIADLLGCGTDAREALVELLSAERVDSQESMRLRLLRDLRSIFAAYYKRNGRVLRYASTRYLLDHLLEMDESPWRNYYNRDLNDKDLGDLLRRYETHSDPLWFRVKGERKQQRGYRRHRVGDNAGLAELWERYLGGDERTVTDSYG